MVESNGDCFPTLIEGIKEHKRVLEEVQSYSAGYCDGCNVKMRVITVSLFGKRQKIGNFCPVCWDINNWVK